MEGNEKQGCRDLLSKLDLDELRALADTVTNKQIKVENKSEAIKAILTYSKSAQQLLRRQKMKRDVLFKYLADNQVVVSLNLDKKRLILSTLKYWGSKVDPEEMEFEDSKDSSSCESLSQSSASSSQSDHSQQQQQQSHHQQQLPESLFQQHLPSPQLSPIIIVNQTHTNYFGAINNFYPSATSGPASASNNPCQTQQLAMTNLAAQDQVLPPSHLKPASSELRPMAEMFVKWFFSNINSHNPTLNKVPEDFGPHHFWDDAMLVKRIHSTELCEEVIKGPTDVSKHLLTLTKGDQLLFNANVSEDGLQVKSDPHGLVLILVCGTVHRSSECLGVFQQLFGIIKDPRYDNNWKIKQVKLEMRTTKVTSMPKLEGNVDDQMKALIPV